MELKLLQGCKGARVQVFKSHLYGIEITEYKVLEN